MNPALVQVVRSGVVESVHSGAFVVTGPDGSILSQLGDVHTQLFPRSSNKPMQALGMLRAGLDVDDVELALVCASHSGEPEHVRRVLALLERHSLAEMALRCPPALPAHSETPDAAPHAELHPRPAAMNCSGKHAGMLATSASRGWPTESYLSQGHPLQRAIAETLAETTGEPIDTIGVDGCGAPLLALSLTGLARAYGGLVTAAAGSQRRRVSDAMRAHPWLVAGTGRDDTLLMLAVRGLLSKGGAEGVHACALPDGTALACKIDDGNPRARTPLVVAALRALGGPPENPAARAVLNTLGKAERQVLGGEQSVGELRVTEAVRDQLLANGARTR